MPYSDASNKPYAMELIARLKPSTVLDVGPGVGTYGALIRADDHLQVERLDAVEVWGPYVEQYRLQEIYDRVVVCDIRYWPALDYDLVILGDVLEHLSFDDALTLWGRLAEHAGAVILSIPIVHFPQGAVDGNPYETHLDPDWSTSKILRRLDGIQEYRAFGTTGVFLAQFRDRSPPVDVVEIVPAQSTSRPRDVVLFVVGGMASVQHPALRDFPLLNRDADESETAHLVRVARVVDDAIAAGGTHLLLPRQHADWLGGHPLLVDYFAEHHELAEASDTMGIVVALRPRAAMVFANAIASNHESRVHAHGDEADTAECSNTASTEPDLLPGNASPIAGTPDESVPHRRAIVCFVEDHPHLIQQMLALRLSWLYSQSPDTDLVVMGPAEVLVRLPDDLVKIPQQPVADDPVWRGYRYVNSIASLNGPGSERLDRYSHILRTDVDTFITPAWNEFNPTVFTVGRGGYSNDDDVRQRLRDIAAQYGLVHRGFTNVGSTWYGPTEVVRRACAFSELLQKHLVTHHFASDEGQWPGWYLGVASMYAGEIAINHCAPDAVRSEFLEVSSTSCESITRYPHIHCWHTDEKFSKHWFMSRRYSHEDTQDLDMNIIRDYCMALSFRSLHDVKPAA